MFIYDASMTIWMWFLLIGLALLIPTAYAGWIGAPWVPTHRQAVRRAFELLGIGRHDVVVDLGVGDGKILIEAARCGAKAYGYELSPIMFTIAWLRALWHRDVKVLYGNFYKKHFPDATVLFAFLVPQTMGRARAFLQQANVPQAKYVLAYAFPFKDVAPLSVVREKKCAPLYVYDAQELTGRRESGTNKA